MNDWLDYKGSGSCRYTSDKLMHAAHVSNAPVSGYDRYMSRISTLEQKTLNKLNGLQKVADQITTGVTYLKTAKANLQAVDIAGIENELEALRDNIDDSNMSKLQKEALRARLNKLSDRTTEKIEKLHLAYDTVDVVGKSLDNALSNFVMK